jgi:hypothetical protein
VLAEGPLLDTRSVEYLAEHRRERHLLIGGAQFFVVFRPAAYFRGLLLTVPVVFVRFAVSGLFWIVVIGAGGPSIATRISFLLLALTVRPTTAQPKISWDVTRAYAEPVQQK